MYRDLIGVPYKPHGRDKNGYDCLGLAIEILARNGIMLHDRGDVEHGLNLEPTDTLENLTVILIRRKNKEHMGIFIGNGMMIHAHEDMGVICEPVWKYKSYVKGLYKVSADCCL